MIDQLKDKLPDWAKDARLNLIKVLDKTQTDGMTPEQIIASALAVAYHLDDQTIIDNLREELGDETLDNAAKISASLMAMNNVYYRFLHLSELPELEHVPAGLRMQGILNSGADKVTFEIMSLAVSILNGCGKCISTHAPILMEHGLSIQAISRIGKIAAVIHAVHVSLRIK